MLYNIQYLNHLCFAQRRAAKMEKLGSEHTHTRRKHRSVPKLRRDVSVFKTLILKYALNITFFHKIQFSI